MAAATPEERSELAAAADPLVQIHTLANEARDAAIAVLRGELDRDTLLPSLDETAARAVQTSPLTHHGRSSQPTSRLWQPCCAMRKLCQCRLRLLHTWPLLRPRDTTAHRAWP